MANPDTRVVISCYQGDTQQVADLMPFFQHHGCPVSLFSPENAPATLPGFDCRVFGNVGQNGPVAHARQLAYLKALLSYPEQFFLMHESDSFCLDAQIPRYLFDTPDTFWSNAISDCGTRPGVLTLSFQAPWFMSRKVITAMTEAADHVVFASDLPWVDHYFVQLVQASGIPWHPFKDAVCCPIAASPYVNISQEHRDIYAEGFRIGLRRAREGANMIHACKSIEAAYALRTEYERRAQ